MSDPALDRVTKERDLYARVLELGTQAADLAPFVEEALGLVVEVTGAERGYLELVDAQGEPAIGFARGLTEAEIPRIRSELSQGIIGRALSSGQTISTASAMEDPRFRDHKSVQAGRIQAVLCAPLRVAAVAGRGATPGEGSAVGVLYLSGRAGAGPFPEADRLRVEMLARHLATFADRLLAKASPRDADPTAAYRAKLAVEGITGRSAALAEVFRQIAVAAPVPVSVLITGDSGTGKTAIARALHDSSPRRAGPFIEINCAALPDALFESELFGAEKGAHSTATARIIGKIEAAQGGTLFLDEVGEIPLASQPKLLSFLQSKTFYRLGGTTPLTADVRVLAATNAPLEERVRDKTFREDLYYRLQVLEISVPPLRRRAEDVGPIADAIAAGLGDAPEQRLPLSPGARAALTSAEWPGNVRQLANAVARGWAVALSEGAQIIEARHLFPDRPEEEGVQSYQEATRRFQGKLLRETLDACDWNVSEAARRLDLARSRLNELIRAHGLTRPPAK